MAMPTCSICLAPLTLRQELKGTYCGHIYHSNCLTQWLGIQRRCPQCRTGIPEVGGMTDLYVNLNLNESFIDVDEQILSQNNQIQNYEREIAHHVTTNSKLEEQIRDLMRSVQEKDERNQILQMELDNCKKAHKQQIAELQKKIAEKPAPKNPLPKKKVLNEVNKENPPVVKKTPTEKTPRVPSASSNSTEQKSSTNNLLFSPMQTRRMRALKTRRAN